MRKNLKLTLKIGLGEWSLFSDIQKVGVLKAVPYQKKQFCKKIMCLSSKMNLLPQLLCGTCSVVNRKGPKLTKNQLLWHTT